MSLRISEACTAMEVTYKLFSLLFRLELSRPHLPMRPLIALCQTGKISKQVQSNAH